MPPVVVSVVVPTRIAAPTGVAPVEITACVFGGQYAGSSGDFVFGNLVGLPVDGKKKFSRGCGNDERPG